MTRRATYYVAEDAAGSKRVHRLKKGKAIPLDAFWSGECVVPAHDLREAVKKANMDYRKAERRRIARLARARTVRPMPCFKKVQDDYIAELSQPTPFNFSYTEIEEDADVAHSG